MRRGRPGRRGSRAPSDERFRAGRRALRKIQVHFEFQQSLMRKIRLAAAAENLSYSDYVRKLVGLPYAKIQRPRISLSFGERDLELLATCRRSRRRRGTAGCNATRGDAVPSRGSGVHRVRGAGASPRAAAVPGG